MILPGSLRRVYKRSLGLTPFSELCYFDDSNQQDFIAHDQDCSQRCLVIVLGDTSAGFYWSLDRYSLCIHVFWIAGQIGTKYQPSFITIHNIVPFHDGYCMNFWRKDLSPFAQFFQCFQDTFRPAARSSRQAFCRSAWGCRMMINNGD